MSYINWFDYKGTKSKTNIFFSNRQNLNLNPQEEIEELNLAWFDFLSKDSANGKLLIKNTYKKDFGTQDLYFIHVTPSFNEIIKSKKIFPSGGGLGAVIYGSTLHKNNKIHNLTEMYLKFQFPKKIKSKVGLFCIKLKIPKELLLQSKNWGVDYTLFGNIHCQTWRKMKKTRVVGNQYSLKLEKKITKDIAKTFKILNIFLEYNLENLTFKRFKKYYNKLFNTIPSLRFIIYESLAEYILFYQNNKSAKFYNTKNEIYNQNHKQFIWDLCPWMLKKFDISKFFIKLDKIISYLHNSNIIKNFDQNHFENFIKWRIAFYVKKITVNKINPKKLNFDYL